MSMNSNSSIDGNLQTPEMLRIDRFDCLCMPGHMASAAEAAGICYLISPVSVDPETVRKWATHRNIVVISGTDWGKDMTPWPAPGIVPGKDDFAGGADTFLDILRSRILPECEARMSPGGRSCTRSLAGLSLSGLFALYAWTSCEEFSNIGCISGSFWYDGFTDWLESKRPLRKSGCAYFSLGEKEGKGGNPRFRNVRENTAAIIARLREDGIRTMFEQTEGSHFTPFYPRMELLLAGIDQMEGR